MTDYITRTGTPVYNRYRKKQSKDMGVIDVPVRIVKVSHNATATAIPASNVINMIPIPANSIILNAWLLIEDAQADTDIKIGVTADDDVFVAAAPLDATGIVLPATTGTSLTGGYFTNAATNITITAITNAINSAIITVVAAYLAMDQMDGVVSAT
jgi:hypothetical protein